MTAFAFLGMLLGAPIIANLTDRFGRRVMLLMSVYLTALFAGVSSLAPTIGWIYLLRFGLGE